MRRKVRWLAVPDNTGFQQNHCCITGYGVQLRRRSRLWRTITPPLKAMAYNYATAQGYGVQLRRRSRLWRTITPPLKAMAYHYAATQGYGVQVCDATTAATAFHCRVPKILLLPATGN